MKFRLEHTIEILSATPDTLSALLGTLSDEWIFATEGPETWSPFDIVGHLIHGEKTDWIPRAERILSRVDTSFIPFDRFAQFQNSTGKSMQDLLATFVAIRRTNLTKLKAFNLTKADLDLKGTHPELGQVSLKNLLSNWAAHDLSHISQIGRVMAKQYKGEVGPWVRYMKILQ